MCLTYTYLFAKSPSRFNRIRSLIASLKTDVDLSLVSMQNCKLRDKKALYFESLIVARVKFEPESSSSHESSSSQLFFHIFFPIIRFDYTVNIIILSKDVRWLK